MKGYESFLCYSHPPCSPFFIIPKHFYQIIPTQLLLKYINQKQPCSCFKKPCSEKNSPAADVSSRCLSKATLLNTSSPNICETPLLSEALSPHLLCHPFFFFSEFLSLLHLPVLFIFLACCFASV